MPLRFISPSAVSNLSRVSAAIGVRLKGTSHLSSVVSDWYDTLNSYSGDPTVQTWLTTTPRGAPPPATLRPPSPKALNGIGTSEMRTLTFYIVLPARVSKVTFAMDMLLEWFNNELSAGRGKTDQKPSARESESAEDRKCNSGEKRLLKCEERAAGRMLRMPQALIVSQQVPKSCPRHKRW